MIVRDEADRYLRACLDHLLEFCDSVRILDDGSTDSFREVDWYGDDRVEVLRNDTPMFMQHEGRARQALLDWTFAADPSHVLAIDADEFVSDGAKLRDVCERDRSRGSIPSVWILTMREVWTATPEELWTREDGLWGPRACPLLYSLPARRNSYRWRIANRAAAPGREPQAVAALRQRARKTDVDILHFGWANIADRADRYARYEGDGFGHNPDHITSIMWGDDRVTQEPHEWPEALAPYAADIVERAQLGADTAPVRKVVVPPATFVPAAEVVGGSDFAVFRKHPDGRWVGVKWDGTIETS